MPQGDFIKRRLHFPKTIPRPPPCHFNEQQKRRKEDNVMYDEEYEDYIMEYYECQALSSPFAELLEEEFEELSRKLNGDYEDDYKHNGRF